MEEIPCNNEAINSATIEQLLEQDKKNSELWSKYSCDCLGFYVIAIRKRIVELGGWPVR